jgi:hypothetical protein
MHHHKKCSSPGDHAHGVYAPQINTTAQYEPWTYCKLNGLCLHVGISSELQALAALPVAK